MCNIGYKATEEHKRKIGESNKGKVRSEEHKKNLSNSLKGRKDWNKGLKGYRHGGSFKKGHIVSKETREKLSKSMKNQYANGRKKHSPWKGKNYQKKLERK